MRTRAELVPSHYSPSPWKKEVCDANLQELHSRDPHGERQKKAVGQPSLWSHDGKGSLQRNSAGDLLFLSHPLAGGNILKLGARPSARQMSTWPPDFSSQAIDGGSGSGAGSCCYRRRRHRPFCSSTSPQPFLYQPPFKALHANLNTFFSPRVHNFEKHKPIRKFFSMFFFSLSQFNGVGEQECLWEGRRSQHFALSRRSLILSTPHWDVQGSDTYVAGQVSPGAQSCTQYLVSGLWEEINQSSPPAPRSPAFPHFPL